MTKEIAHLPAANCTQLLDVLGSLGWGVEHPITAEITGWSNQGEPQLLLANGHLLAPGSVFDDAQGRHIYTPRISALKMSRVGFHVDRF
jgi:hypothetical protein